jgi:hypothetical protein
MIPKANSDNVIHRQGRIAVLRETDKHGDDTGAAYYQCQCGAELTTDWNKAQIPHEDGCPEGADQ